MTSQRQQTPQDDRMPDHFGTGSRPDRSKSRLPVIVLLLLILIGTNLVTIALRFGPREASEQTARYAAADSPQLAVLPDLTGEEQDPQMERAGPELCASMGISVTQLSEMQSSYWQLPRGVLISEAHEDGSAYLSGIRSGDVLLSIDDMEITDSEQYEQTMAEYLPGDTVTVRVYRLGREYSMKLVLQNSVP